MIRLSTRQKREIQSFSSLLLHLAVFIVLLLTLGSCETVTCAEPAVSCDTPATVRDLRGLDGCGFVFVLEDGRRLEPIYPNRGWCGTPPLPSVPEKDLTPIEKFTLKDGQRVRIAYTESNRPSICMAGKTVEITCITEVSAPTGASN